VASNCDRPYLGGGSGGAVSCRFGSVAVSAGVEYNGAEGSTVTAFVSPAGVGGRRVPLWVELSPSTRQESY